MRGAHFLLRRDLYCCVCFFFFQAEDGIRDLTVTGVQTCALPILWGVVSAITGAVVARLAWCDPLPPARLFTAGRNREAIRLNRIALSGFTGRASSSMGTTPSGGARGIG